MRPETFARGLRLPECPRWHEGALWASDMWSGTVQRFAADGTPEVVCRIDDDAGGTGWLPDGRLLVVSMLDRRVLRLDDDGPILHADLAALAPWPCNDMVVAADGTAYVSHFGFDFFGGRFDQIAPATVIRLSADGVADAVAGDVWVPNGMAVSDDGATLVVAESGAGRLTAFPRGRDGALGTPSTFAELLPAAGQPVAPPDGICLDEAGAVWAAEPLGRRVLRVEAGGTVTDEIGFDLMPLAAVLGGEDRRSLYVCLVPDTDRSRRDRDPAGRIDVTPVAVPGAGRP